jgi:putative ABC transport system substrate-binding protein
LSNEPVARDTLDPARRGFVRALALAACTAPGLTACASRTLRTRIPTIGYLSGDGTPELLEAFTDELRRLGMRDGRNVLLEVRLARSNTADTTAMAAELARLDLALIVAAALGPALEVRRANPSMPMVIATCPGMVSNGFADSLERPGGIYTGMDELPGGVTATRLELLKTAAPAVTRVALLSTTPGVGGHETQLADAERAARDLGVEVRPYRASSLAEVERALAAIASDGMNGMMSFQGGLALVNRRLIVEFAARQRIPAVYQATLFAEAGGLIAWAPDLVEQFREAARFTARILAGAKPGDLAVRTPERYYLTINARAAHAIGLELPQALVARADRVLR